MKSVSLVLRIVAIVGAIACVALFFSVKGQIKQATQDMKDVSGATLVEKSARVPGLVQENAKLKKDLNSSEANVQNLTTKSKSLASDLESERASNIRVNKEKAELTNEVRTVKINLQDAKKNLDDAVATIEKLKKEIVAIRQSTSDNGAADALKQKVAVLEGQLSDLTKKYEVAAEKARIYDLSEIVVVEDIVDPEAGKRTTKKVLKVPYVATGDTATVTRLESSNDLAAINRGKKDKLALDQVIDLKRDGEYVGRVTVVEIGEDFAIVSINPKLGIPETIESGDILELVPTVDLSKGEEQKDSAPANKA